MNRIFLSHSSHNKDFVRNVANKLGDKAIIDERDFQAGARTIDEIVEKMKDSSIFVIFLSLPALDSSWVKKELALAITHCIENNLKIIVFSIDKRVKYSDHRIPENLRINYNIRFIKTPEIAVSYIRDEDKRLSLDKSPALRKAQGLFIGRSEEVQKFENDFSNITGDVPTFIIAYNYYEGIGRTHFIKHCLNKINIIRSSQEPFTIVMQRGESIENFIIKLNSLVFNDEATKADLQSLALEKKKQIALELVCEYKHNSRIIFIRDEGAIVLPNHEVVQWFDWLIQAPELHNRTTFCLISMWEPNYRFLNKENGGVAYHIKEMDKIDTQNLFLQLINIFGQHSLSTKEKEEIISNLMGIPSQTIFTVKQIQTQGVQAALLNAQEIREYNDSFSASLLDSIKQNNDAYQLCLVLSTGILSLDVLSDVFGDENKIKEAINYLRDYSAVDLISANITSVKLNSTLSDFIRRRRLVPDSDVMKGLEYAIKRYLSVSFDDLVIDDYSKFILAIEECMRTGKTIPTKYYIAPLLIDNIIKEYNAGHYEAVERYCISLLRQINIDPQVQWELQYHLVRVYARKGKEEFWDALKDSNLKYIDREFLIGFFYRNKKNVEDIRIALEHFHNVLSENNMHQRARREIVNTYLLLEDYVEALKYAQDNYEQSPSDIMHLHAYFTALIRSESLDPSIDYTTLSYLIDSAKKNKDLRSVDILRCMEGEFAYYINHDFTKAIKLLNEAKQLNENRLYPIKALLAIYRREGMFEDANRMRRELQGNETL